MSDKQTYPNAGPNADVGRYRTGETPMVGDVVRMNQEYIGGIRFCTAPFDSTVTAIRKESVGYLLHATGHEPCYPIRFDLIRRADSPDAGKMVDPAHEPTLIDPTVEPYEIGVRDGYQQAAQDIDILTGGDGEYYYSTDDGGCPDAEAMKARIAERFEALKAAVERAKGGG